jgi:hypothetical protein
MRCPVTRSFFAGSDVNHKNYQDNRSQSTIRRAW